MSTKVRTQLWYQVPSMFMLKEVALQWLKDAGIKNPRLSVGKLYFLLNHLRVTSHIHERRYGGRGNGWVPISRDIICDLFGNMTYFYPIMKKLESDGLVEIHTNYIIGKQCKRYRLKPIIDDDEWKVIEVTTAECSTTRKVIEFFQQNWRPIDHKLYNRLTQIYIDDIPFFEQTTVHNFQDYPCELLSILMQGLRKKQTPQHRYSKWKSYYNDIRVGEWRYSVDEFGRRHNNLTNLPKVLREYLYVFKRGEKRRFKNVDITNSQVLLLLTILPDSLERYENFKEIVEEGVFYELLATLCGRSRPEGRYKDFKSDDTLSEAQRKALKKEYFHYVYGDNNHTSVTDGNVFQAMYENFNDINGYLCALKNRKGYEYPSRQMQKQESSIIIDHVCYRALNVEGLKFAQIYDSILCLEEDVEMIKQLITEGFKKQNLNVTLKVE